MAQAPLCMDQFSCSICLELLRDPVTIPCGHSYCMSCLSQHWDRQSVCTCPQCRATFSPRPTLGRNTLLVEMLERMKTSEGPSAPPLYEDHGFQHAVFDVSSVRPQRTDGERLLGETRRHLAKQISESELELQQLKHALHSFSRLAKSAVKDSSQIFTALQEFLEHRRVEVKQLIRAQEKAEVTRAETQLQRMERRLSELRRRDAELERISRDQDQNLILQACQRYNSPATPGADGQLMVSPHVSFKPVRKAVSELKEHLQMAFDREFQTVTSAVKTVNILEVKKADAVTHAASPAHSLPTLDNRNDLLQNFCSLSLDPFTTHRELSLADGNHVVCRTGEYFPYPDHPDRFDSWCQVMCREGRQEGRSYWEVEWEGQQVALGLAYESIGRKGSSKDCQLGGNSSSWCLKCSSFSSFTFHHRNQAQDVVVPSGAAPRRIGVFVDLDGGTVCFYAVSSEGGGVHLLHRAQTSFVQSVFPALWLGPDSKISLCSID